LVQQLVSFVASGANRASEISIARANEQNKVNADVRNNLSLARQIFDRSSAVPFVARNIIHVTQALIH